MQSSNVELAITGVSGFIGKYLTKQLIVDGTEYLNLDTRYPFDNSPVLEGVSTIIHLAGLAHDKAESEEMSRSVNFLYPVELARLAKEQGVKKFIFISSANVYTEQEEKFITEESPVKAKNYPIRHKLESERELLKLGNIDFSIIILRIPLVYAIDAPANFAKLLSLSLKLPVQPFGLANSKRSYLSINNLTSALVHMNNYNTSVSGVFNLTDDCDISTKELVSGIRSAFGYNTLHVLIPPKFIWLSLFIIGKSNIADILFNENRLEITKFKHTFGWSPMEKTSEALNKLREQNDTIN